MATPLPQVPGYFALRTGADMASSIRGQTVYFTYAPGTIEIGNSTGTPRGVPVNTPPSAVTRPEVGAVLVSLDGGDPLSLPAAEYSALFWSESAVEKFLLPYFASAAGPHALQGLQNITQAWYNYADTSPVVALAFSYPTQPMMGPRQLWDALTVIYQDGAQLAAQPLLQYLENPQGPDVVNTPPPPQATGTEPPQATSITTPVDSLGAREVAEFVSGLRGREVEVYRVDGLPGGLEPVLTPQRVEGGTLQFRAFSPYVHAGRPRPTIQFQVNGQDEPITITGSELGAEYDPDAAFWTDGAVDMLMLPYYASVQGAWAPWYLMLVLGTWSGAIPPWIEDAAVLLQILGEQAGWTVRSLANLPGETDPVLEVAEAWTMADPGEPQPESQVFALVHLPRSEWVDETSQLAVTETVYLEHRTRALTPRGAYPLVAPPNRLIPRRQVRG